MTGNGDKTDESSAASTSMPDFGDQVDLATFSQILEMDDDEVEREFSKPLVLNFFEQAEDTFTKIDVALQQKDLGELSRLGHFLKGSSATLGFNKVRDSCQIIQQYGNKQHVDGSPETDQAVCIAKITDAVKAARSDLNHLKRSMKEFFGDSDSDN